MEQLNSDLDELLTFDSNNMSPSMIKYSVRHSSFNSESFGLDDLQKIIEKNNKTQKMAAEASSSLSHLIKSANNYVLEMQLLEDLENLIKDNGAKKQCQTNNLMSNNNWAKLYGLDMNQDVEETYSKIRQNIQQLIYDTDLPAAEESVDDNSTEKTYFIDKNSALKRITSCLKQEKRPQSTSAIERPSDTTPKVRGILNSRPKTSRNEIHLSTAVKKSLNTPPRNAVSEEDASKLTATKDNRYQWADCKTLWPTFNFEIQNQQSIRSSRDLINNYLPKI